MTCMYKEKSEMSSPRACSLRSSPSSSPNVAALLQIKILSWSQETGFPVCIRVRVGGKSYNLHKVPLSCKSRYLREKLDETKEVELPPNFPGGAESFQTMALFMYDSSSALNLIDPFNAAALRCAAEFLRIDDGLCNRFDIYLNQVVLQSWDDTLIVLHTCQTLLPWAENLLIVTRCIETLAFMACMEILDPESRTRSEAVVTLEALAGAPWSDGMVREMMRRDVWIRDVVALPPLFFRRVVASLRRQGMKEKYVTPIILFYAHKWVIRRDLESHLHHQTTSSSSTQTLLLQGLIDLLPRSCKVIPVGFYLSLVSASLKLGLRKETVEKLQCQIASALHLAHPQDLLMNELPLVEMERIFSSYFHQHQHQHQAAVALLWDLYLIRIAGDSELGCNTFISLIQTPPPSTRQMHDHLYRALNAFFQSHPNLSPEEKGSVCKSLNCHKLSQQVCIEAVQNEQMPLRLMVQALFVQQLNTQQAFKHSFRCGEFSGTPSCNSKSQNLGESPYSYIGGDSSRPLGLLLQRPDADAEVFLETSRKDYESTSFRIQNLEKELIFLKRNLQLQQMSSKAKLENKGDTTPRTRSEKKKKKKKKKKNQNQNMHSSCCVGGASVNFASQRKYTNKILKILQKLILFARGSGRPNTNTS